MTARSSRDAHALKSQSKEPKLRVSVVICAYTEERWVMMQQAVASVEGQLGVVAEVIVVIDHNDWLCERAKSEWPEYIVTSNHHGRGLSGARNTGTEAAQGDVVAFLDDDAVADPGWLGRFLPHFANPKVGGLGGAVHPSWVREKPGWFPDEFLWVVGCSYRGLPEAVAEIRNPIGASMIFRRQILVDAGGFREEVGRVGALPVGCEETELSIRTGDLGFVILYVPDSVVRHVVPQDRGRLEYFTRRCLLEGRSKAVVARLVGADRALASESSYAKRILPRAVLRNLVEAVSGDGLAALGRAATIILGLFITGIGYAEGRVLRRSSAVSRSGVPSEEVR